MSLTRLGNSLSLSLSHPSIPPSPSHPIHEPVLVVLGARDCVCMGDCWGRRASTPHQGEIAHQELGTTSLIHVCKWRDIQTCIQVVDVCFGNCICTYVFEYAVRACVYTVYVLALLHNLHTLHCVASAAKGNKTMAGLPCNVELRRDAATTRLLEAASACSTQQR